MNWPGFFVFSNLWFALLAVPIIVFYFLKLKRPRLEIPSLILWQQVLADHRVNSPFQRFKRNVLLLLQLLILALLVFSAMQPYVRGDEERVENLPILIDCSASMGAVDQNTQLTRLDQAKQRVRNMIDAMLPDQRYCLMSFSRTAKKLTGFTNNKRILHDALDKIEVKDLPSDIEDALRMTQALAQNASFEKVLMLSDGNIPAKTDFSLPFTLDYQKLDSDSPNIGITALNARCGRGNQWDVFVHIHSSSKSLSSGEMQLLRNGEVIASESVSVSFSQPERLAFSVGIDEKTSIELRLKAKGFDALSSDNVAYLVLQPTRPIAVYVQPTVGVFGKAFRAMEGVDVYPKNLKGDNGSDRKTFDLIIGDQQVDKGLSAMVTLGVGYVPEELADLVTIEEGDSEVVDWSLTEPLLDYVQLAELVLMDSPVNAAEVNASDFENRGYEILIHGRFGPLMLRKREGKMTHYAMLFHPDRSTLPYRVAFPVLLSNLTRITAQELGLAEVFGHATGVLPAVQLEMDARYTIAGPGELKRSDEANSVGLLSGVPAERVGQYTISRGGEVKHAVGVSLLNDIETTLGVVDQLQFNELAVTAKAQVAEVDRSFWSTIALIALCILIVEWWFYQKRPTVARN